MKTVSLRWLAVAVISAGLSLPLSAQDAPAVELESRFAQANGVRLQYVDFGGAGLPLIFVQDVHNVFDAYFTANDPGAYSDPWTAFMAQFSDRHRVIATVRRGYGQSEDPGYGYDVATSSEDLVALMDALGFERAVLFGRTMALSDMTWIAEHHPERVAGLVYIGNPLPPDRPDPSRVRAIDPVALADARRLTELTALSSCDLQEDATRLLNPRSAWRPHFLTDTTSRIDLPALRFWSPAVRQSMGLRRMDRIEAALDEVHTWEPDCPGQAPYIALLDSMANDRARWAAIREVFEATDMTVAMDDGIVRAFGENMETSELPADLGAGWGGTLAFMAPRVDDFLIRVRELEARR